MRTERFPMHSPRGLCVPASSSVTGAYSCGSCSHCPQPGGACTAFKKCANCICDFLGATECPCSGTKKNGENWRCQGWQESVIPAWTLIYVCQHVHFLDEAFMQAFSANCIPSTLLGTVGGRHQRNREGAPCPAESPCATWRNPAEAVM